MDQQLGVLYREPASTWGRTDVLLHAAVDDAVLADVDGLREEHRADVGDQDLALGVGKLVVDGAVDGVVLADVDVVRVLAHGEVGAVGDVGEGLVGAGGDLLSVDEALGLGEGLLGPHAGVDVVSLAGRAGELAEVQRDGRELLVGATLQEQDLVVGRNAHQVAEVGFGLVDDVLEHLGAVAHLVDAHAATAVVEHLVCGFLQD